MHNAKIIVVYITLILFFSTVVTSSAISQDNQIPFWNTDWSYRQEIQLPISTNSSHSKYQPIDIQLTFDNPCWTRNENETSIRVCCWDGDIWYELESQIYDLVETQTNYIDQCNLVFLIPNIANGREKYYIYYDDAKKSNPQYIDHVTIEDKYYFSTPISDVTAEAKYYEINEDGYCVYGVGQEGKLLDRSFSNIIVKQKKSNEKFDLLNADQIVSFAFSYYYGNNEEDESSSDQSFVHKEIFVDGNLMVEFGIISESNRKEIRTTAIYKYYYTPLEEKRICARVKHELSDEVIVKGKENIDGRFGIMFSFKSRNPVLKKMNFGDIFPNLRFYGENEKIEEYQMNLDPETKKREWILSYEDDADLGNEAWIAYGDDETGYTNAIIFSSDKGIVSSGTDEQDGIQIKVAEKEYFNFLGTEIDYAAINFGRNSYEKGHSHDLRIPEDLVVEFDVELFSTNNGGYSLVQKEAKIYQELIKNRQPSGDSAFEEEQKKYSLTIATHLGGTRFTYPWLADKTNKSFPVMWIELWKNRELSESGVAKRFFLHRGQAFIHFPKVVGGDYLIKVYWKLDNSTRFFRGAKTISLNEDSKVHIFCTWERSIELIFSDQNGHLIEGINAVLTNEDDVIFDENETDQNGFVILRAPFKLRNPYLLKAYYRGFLVYNGEIQNSIRDIEIGFNIELFDLTVNIIDKLNQPPGVQISPKLITYENEDLQINSKEIEPGMFFFENVPLGKYIIQIAYGSFVDEEFINIPYSENQIDMLFSANYEVIIKLYNSHGENLDYENVYFEIERNGKIVIDKEQESFLLPPGNYKIKAYADGDYVGSKEIDVLNNKNIKIVTNVQPIIPVFVVSLSIVTFCVLIILTLMKKIEFMSFLKLLALILIIVALVQPWWSFSGTSTTPIAERNTHMFVYQQAMIESTIYNGKTSYDVAEMPEPFIDMLKNIVLAVYAVCSMIIISFIINIFNKKKYSELLEFLNIILLIAIISLFYVGTSKICEASIGYVQGDGIIGVKIIYDTVNMQSVWGFTFGFYLLPLSILIIFSFLIFWLMIHNNKNEKCENTSAWTLMYATYFIFALSFALITISFA